VTRRNGHGDNGNAGLIDNLSTTETLDEASILPLPPDALPGPATRAKQRAKQQIQQNRFVIVAAGAVVTAFLIFVAVSVPHRSAPKKAKNQAATRDGSSSETGNESDDKSLFPITDSGRPAAKQTHQGFLNERDLQRTVIRSSTNGRPPGFAGEAVEV
jgi:hypothetical protein